MEWALTSTAEMRKVYKILVEKLEGKTLHVRCWWGIILKQTLRK
jgi:hypothetical protein